MSEEKQIYLNQKELAERWRKSPRTLANLRSLGKGPPFYKIEGSVLYKKAEIEQIEQQAIQNS